MASEPEQPLERARKRLKRKRSRIVRYAARGLTPREIEKKTAIPASQIRAELALPETQDALLRARGRVKSIVMHRAEKVMEGAFDVVEGAISDRDAKSLEMSTRAALNLEKLTQSASGETQRVEVTGQINVDVRAILAQLAGS